MQSFNYLCGVSSETLELLRGKIGSAEDIISSVQIHKLMNCNIFIIPHCRVIIRAPDKDNWVCSFARSSGKL